MLKTLLLPYLYFKDFGQSSGVIHQAQIAKALASAGVGVTFVLPSKKDGWQWSVHELFGSGNLQEQIHPNISVVEVSMHKDQHMWTGFWPEEFLKLLSPMRTDVIFDMVLNMVPPMSGGVMRALCDVGFSRMSIPVINFFDTVTVPEEHSKRGGNLPDYLETLKVSEVASVLQANYTIITTANEKVSLTKNMQSILAPSAALKGMKKLAYVPKPLTLPEPFMRKTPEDGIWRIFMGRSFGKDWESGGKNGEQVSSVVHAVKLLSAMHKVKLVLCTRSPIDEWVSGVLDQLDPSNLELVHNQDRWTVLEKLKSCHLAIDLRDYDGLYMAALEQQASGAVTVTKASKWAYGEIEPSEHVTSYDPVEIATAMSNCIHHFDAYALTALERGLQTTQDHDLKLVGQKLRIILEQSTPKVVISPSMQSLLQLSIDNCQWDHVNFKNVKEDVLSHTNTGNIGRYPDIWLLDALQLLGCTVQKYGGFGSSSYIVSAPGVPS